MNARKVFGGLGLCAVVLAGCSSSTSESSGAGTYTATVITYDIAGPDSVVEHLSDSATVAGGTITFWAPPGPVLRILNPGAYAVGAIHLDSTSTIRIAPAFEAPTTADSGTLTISTVSGSEVAGSLTWRGFDYRLTARFRAAVR